MVININHEEIGQQQWELYSITLNMQQTDVVTEDSVFPRA